MDKSLYSVIAVAEKRLPQGNFDIQVNHQLILAENEEIAKSLVVNCLLEVYRGYVLQGSHALLVPPNPPAQDQRHGPSEHATVASSPGQHLP